MLSRLLGSLKSSPVTKPELLNPPMSSPIERLGAQLTVELGRTSYKHHALASSLLFDKSKTVHFDRPFICKLEK